MPKSGPAPALRGLGAQLRAALGAAALGANPALGADHRDAPLTKTNAQLDINDVYVFKGTEGMVGIMTVNPLTSPAATAGLRRAERRPSAWWFPLLCPDGGWFRETARTAEAYWEPLD